MTKKALEAKLAALKSDYIRIQGDVEKLENVGKQISSAEKHLIRLEEEIAEVNRQLDELD